MVLLVELVFTETKKEGLFYMACRFEARKVKNDDVPLFQGELSYVVSKS